MLFLFLQCDAFAILAQPCSGSHISAVSSFKQFAFLSKQTFLGPSRLQCFLDKRIHDFILLLACKEIDIHQAVRVRSHFWLGSDISFLASPGFVQISQSLLLVLAFAGPSAAGLLSLPWLAGFLHAAFAGAAFFFGDMSFAGTSSPLEMERTDFALGEVSLHSRGQEQHAHSLCRLCLWS